MSRSKQSLSSYHLTTLNLGDLVPINVLPVLPGDTIGHVTNLLLRVSPLAAPVMHQVDVRIHHFYVANRTIWNDNDGTDWEEFITGGEDGMNTDTVPIITTDGVAGGLLDHMGVPPVAAVEVNALPVRAVNFIWNEFYRDQDLQIKRLEDDLTLPKCAWEKDYFTTARPWSQKGPAVSIPVGSSAPITSDAIAGVDMGIISTNQSGTLKLMPAASTNVTMGSGTAGATNAMYADLSNAEGADPIDVRTAWGLQRFMENAAKYGSRYPEKMRQLGSHYKGLMDRPIYLGGGNQAINFSEVIQTAQDASDRAFGVGDLYGHGIAATRSNKYAKRIDEHGYVISLLSVRPRTLYQDGVHREWLKLDREDFHDPYLEFVGAQTIQNHELKFGDALGKDTFGYTDRYDEYRQGHNIVTSEMRDVLDYWHLGRQFATLPVLNDSFVTCTPSKRIFNEQTQDSLWVMAHHKIAAHRNISKRASTRTF